MGKFKQLIDFSFLNFRVATKNIQEIDSSVSLNVPFIQDAKLQIAVVSPQFVSCVNLQKSSDFEQIFSSRKVLALLLGVSQELILSTQAPAFSSYNEWHRLTVRNSDISFVEEVLKKAREILKRSGVQPSKVLLKETVTKYSEASENFLHVEVSRIG
ncbi:hypothetical protein SK128_004109 [Halocaridina rubra]|uniref:Uncharacterized protein n=1 Tax=Halocaridina rubra TaxID=373956 RepID=A0AAN8WZ53_HALRR